jgi:hypothetical protein
MMFGSKIVEHPILPSEVKTGCQSHFRSRSYGGKSLPGYTKLVEEAEIGQYFIEQICAATQDTLRYENRMSVVLPVGGETLPVWPKLVKGVHIAQKLL